MLLMVFEPVVLSGTRHHAARGAGEREGGGGSGRGTAAQWRITNTLLPFEVRQPAALKCNVITIQQHGPRQGQGRRAGYREGR